MRSRICVFPDAASTLRVPNGQERWPVNCHQKPTSRAHAPPPTHILDAQLPLLQLEIHPVGDLPGSCVPNGNPTLAIPHGQLEMCGGVRGKKKGEPWTIHSLVAWISSLLSLCCTLPYTPVILTTLHTSSIFSTGRTRKHSHSHSFSTVSCSHLSFTFHAPALIQSTLYSFPLSTAFYQYDDQRSKHMYTNNGFHQPIYNFCISMEARSNAIFLPWSEKIIPS